MRSSRREILENFRKSMIMIGRAAVSPALSLFHSPPLPLRARMQFGGVEIKRRRIPPDAVLPSLP